MLSWEFPPRSTGGIAAHVAGLGTALARAGHDVVILTVADRPAELDAKPPDLVRVLRTLVDLPWLPPSEEVTRIASANHAITKLGSRFVGELDGWRPDIVHGHDWQLGWAADSLAHRYGVPFVLTMHGTERVRHGGQLPLGHPTDINSIEWWLAFQADRMISPTRFIVEQLITGFELAEEHVVHIPNGIDPELWRPANATSVPTGPRPPLVVSWGRVQYEKGFQVLARAMHQLRGRVPEVSSVIAGRGSYLPELQTQVDVEGVSDIVESAGLPQRLRPATPRPSGRLRRDPLALRAVRDRRARGAGRRRSADRGEDGRARRVGQRHERRRHLRARATPTISRTRSSRS